MKLLPVMLNGSERDMQVIEIFNSIDGEVNDLGQGTLSTFIRLAGCNLSCSYCDTASSQDQQAGKQMSIEEILNKVVEIGCRKITITGGEPLLQVEELSELIDLLHEENCHISMETNGTMDLASVHAPVDCIIMNYKMQSPPLSENYGCLTKSDYLKIMIDDMELLQRDALKQILDNARNKTRARIAVSPVLAQVSTKELLSYLQKHHLWWVQINLQLHKFVQIA